MHLCRVVTTGEPRYLYNRLMETMPRSGYETRHGANPATPRLALTRSSWRHRVIAALQMLPRELVELPRGENRDGAYRRKLKDWVKLAIQ